MSKVQAQMKTASNSITSETSKIKSAVSGIKTAIAGIAVGTGLFQLGKQAINTASALQEVQNVVDVAFGDMSWKAERFAQSALESFGMSELSAKRTASTYMAMASGMGLSNDVASDMAITLAGLTGDVASFYNISQELADIKLKSVFTGETETLKDLGIVMTQANLQAYALSQGITKNVSDMTQAEATTLRYNFVLSQLSMAQGDFSRTSGSWANQIRILKEQFSQLWGIIGNGIISALTPVVQAINAIISKIITFANVVSGVLGRLFGKKSAGQQASSGFTSANNAAKQATVSTGGLNNALKGTEGQAKKTAKALGSLAGFDELNTISASDSGSSGGSGGTGTGGVGGGGYSVDPIDWDNAFPEPDTSGVEAMVDKVIGHITRLKEFISANVPIITSLLAGLLAGFIAFEVVKNWDFIKKFVMALSPVRDFLVSMAISGGGIKGFFAAIAAGIQSISLNPILALKDALLLLTNPLVWIPALVAAVTASLVYLYQTSDSFRKLVNEAVGALLGILQNFYNSCLVPIFDTLVMLFNTVLVPLGSLLTDVFLAVVEAVASIVLSFWTNVLAPIADFLVGVLGIAIQGVCDILQAWMPVINSVIGILKTLWDTALKPIVNFIKDTFITIFEIAGTVISAVASAILTVFEGLVQFFVTIFTFNMTDAWDTVCGIFQSAWETICEIFTPLGEWFGQQWENVKTAFANVGEWFGNVFSSAWDKICEAFSSVKTFFSGVWNNITGAFGDIAGWFKGKFSDAWTAVKNVFSTGGKIFDGIKDGILNGLKAIVNGIIGGINKVIAVPFNGINKALKAVRDFSILGQKPFKGLVSTITVPQIPKLAYGGVVDRATLGVFGEAGTEAVIPLQRNTRGLELIADKIAERLPIGDGSNGGTYVINLVLENGKVLTKMVIDNIKEYEIQTGKPVFDY